MKEPAYRRGKYNKNNVSFKEDEMDIRTEKAMEIIHDLVKNGAVEKSPLARIPKYNIKQGKGDEEEMVLLFSDLQVGHKSPSTNLEILKKRVDTLTKAVIKIVTLQRQAIPIKKLNVFMLGDMIQSEDIMTKVDLDSLEMVLMDQIFKGAVPLTENMLLSLLPLFPDGIDIYCVSGNHGAVSKMSAPSTNWDTIIFKMLQAKTENYKNLRWHIEEKLFYQQVTIQGKKFMLSHGDCIPRYLNIPIYGITQRAMRWQGSIGEFEYLCLGHKRLCPCYSNVVLETELYRGNSRTDNPEGRLVREPVTTTRSAL